MTVRLTSNSLSVRGLRRPNMSRPLPHAGLTLACGRGHALVGFLCGWLSVSPPIGEGHARADFNVQQYGEGNLPLKKGEFLSLEAHKGEDDKWAWAVALSNKNAGWIPRDYFKEGPPTCRHCQELQQKVEELERRLREGDSTVPAAAVGASGSFIVLGKHAAERFYTVQARLPDWDGPRDLKWHW
ncbi:unnamed protein product [Polarella glacialis]|uniref:SH3 domain-containing protein n=1 Tax=Polarella glacialis TaxID=89957 RepID=A0A813IIY5_POLGL|nr:unnamed protein product [Polarella glacialis]CAE8650116.1 unnamed protein product [Polarella glacialis]